MKNNSEEKRQQTDEKFFVERNISERALLGYCSFHHMLLYFVKKYPEIQDKVNKQVEAFMNSESARSKNVVPNMGEFLATLSISSYSWGQVAKTVLEEIFERNVLWNAKKNSHLGKPLLLNGGNPKVRLDHIWKASLVSQRLVMFQVYFLTHVARPNGKSLEEVFSRYNYTYGRPNEAMKNNLHNACNYLVKVNSWPGLFRFLNEAIKNSARRGYHRIK